MKSISRFIMSMLLVFACVLGTVALTGCGPDESAQQAEQDNCYGDDLPVINN